MRLYEGDIELLRTLAAAPFLDRSELAALSGRSRAAVYERVDLMSEAGLLDSVTHATALLQPTRRYCLTARGVRRLAAEEQSPVIRLLRTRPVSEQWRRLLLQRLDAVAAIYRLTESAAQSVSPLRLRWFRAGPLDAVLDLPEGRRVAIVRQGQTADRTAFAKRIHRLRETRGFGATLLLSPDETRLRQAQRLLGGAPVLGLLALERDLIRCAPHAAIWRPCSGSTRMTLHEALSLAVPSSGLSDEPPLAHVSTPRDLGSWKRHPNWLLPARLSPTEKRALALIGDWLWIRPAHLAGVLAVSTRRLAHILSRLQELHLVSRVNYDRAPRLSLTDDGLASLARRDRASVGNARNRWSTTPIRPAHPFAWRNVRGARARQLLRHLDHTDSVHRFVAALSKHAAAESLEIDQLDPPHRASRYFRLEGAVRSVQPDAFISLLAHGGKRAYFLEYERRAVRPVTMAARLAPYLRYYGSSRPLEDHGVIPTILIVFEDEVAADHFRRVARQEMARAAVELPLLVSDRRTVERLGPLGGAWASPAHPRPISPL